jgi:hypothetical protein
MKELLKVRLASRPLACIELTPFALPLGTKDSAYILKFVCRTDCKISAVFYRTTNPLFQIIRTKLELA